ncbi:Proteophosphoglycan 5 [Rhodotorula toruloides ATCC 204091]|uniref:Proteophosphoglycan 5 n=1 Tax=Rhodotorula toruloides TaxID=5286 RepID=A0A0K3CL11_RHOTO|nr:Proteophosphoglycan 5 [Rhodotorula toruloides ATCC 204091]PRQ72043.1 Proteophosphoglycan 5 [Rhodotorula toruloides]
MSTTAETALAAETAPADSASPATSLKSQASPAGRPARASSLQLSSSERCDNVTVSPPKKAVPLIPAVKTLSLEPPPGRRPLPAQRRPTPTRPLSAAEQDYLADYDRRERCRKECGINISAFASVLVKLCMHRYEGRGQTLEEYKYDVLYALRCRYEEGRLAHFSSSKSEDRQPTSAVASTGRVTRFRGSAEAEAMARGVLAERRIKAYLESQGLLVTQSADQQFSRAVDEAVSRARHLGAPVYLAPQSLKSVPFLDEFGDQGYNQVKFGRFVPDLIEFKRGRGGEVVWSVVKIKFTYDNAIQKTSLWPWCSSEVEKLRLKQGDEGEGRSAGGRPTSSVLFKLFETQQAVLCLDIAALVAVLFRLNDAYAERENAFLSEWEDYLTSELRQSFCVGHHGAFEDLEREGWRGGKPDRPDSWFPPQVLRQKEERWEEVAKQQFEEKGDLVRQEAGETFVECMERAAQMVRDKEKQDTSLKKANTVFVEPGFITSEDWTSHFKQRGFARGIDFAPFKPELIVLHSREDGMVGWAPAKFVFTTSGYEDQGVSRMNIERQLADHPILRPMHYIML